MIIRASQMQKFEEVKVNEFRRFMIAFLREQFAEECEPLSDADISARIEAHTSEANTYDIVDENSVAKFIYLKWLLGEEFEELPDPEWLFGLLEDRARPAVQRMEIATAGVEYQFEQYGELAAAA
jgi:hypothetical protein